MNKHNYDCFKAGAYNGVQMDPLGVHGSIKWVYSILSVVYWGSMLNLSFLKFYFIFEGCLYYIIIMIRTCIDPLMVIFDSCWC